MSDQIARALAIKALNKPAASASDVKVAVDDYLTKHPVTPGATEEQAAQIEQNKQDVNQLSADVSIFVKIDSSVNLFDKNDVLSGYAFNTNNGAWYSSSGTASSIISGWIPVTELTTYRAAYFKPEGGMVTTGGVVAYIGFYSDKFDDVKDVSQYFLGWGATVNGSIAPAGAKYARFRMSKAVYTDVLERTVFAESEKFPLAYVEHYTRKAINLDNINPHFAHPVFGKKILWGGDSVCYGLGDNGRAWSARFAEQYNANCVKTAVSGSTITRGVISKSSGAVLNSISEDFLAGIAENPDAAWLIFEGCTNDADNIDDEKIGSFDANDFSGQYDDTTFCGAFETILYTLSNEKLNGAHVGWFSCPKMYSQQHNYTTSKRRQFIDKCVEMCQKWNIPYLDLWTKSGLNPEIVSHYDPSLTADERMTRCFYRDTQHPAAKGYDHMMAIMADWLARI